MGMQEFPVLAWDSWHSHHTLYIKLCGKFNFVLISKFNRYWLNNSKLHYHTSTVRLGHCDSNVQQLDFVKLCFVNKLAWNSSRSILGDEVGKLATEV